jgi:hypothetical protein
LLSDFAHSKEGKKVLKVDVKGHPNGRVARSPKK